MCAPAKTTPGIETRYEGALTWCCSAVTEGLHSGLSWASGWHRDAIARDGGSTA
jgi:hypothetical protein